MNIQALMKQAQSLQKEMFEVKKELNETDFIGESSLVKVVLKGDKSVVSVNINKTEKLDSDDIEMLEDMILIAMNDAIKKIDKVSEEKLGKYGNAIPSFF